MVDNRVILAGAIPAALLALAADGAVGLIERAVAPRRRRTPMQNAKFKMQN
jgi:osmoprotectant transport system permease protein